MINSKDLGNLSRRLQRSITELVKWQPVVTVVYLPPERAGFCFEGKNNKSGTDWR